MIIDGITLIENSLPKNVQITPLTESQRLALSSVNSGEMVFQTDQDAGIYVYNGTAWQPLASFDITGKLELSRLPSSILGDMRFKGNFDGTNASSLPTPNSTVGDPLYNVGHFYICTVAGTINSVSYDVQDFAISNGTAWVKIPNANVIKTVNNIQPVNGNINVTFGGDISIDVATNAATVNKIKNIEISGTPATGKVLKLSSASTASWDFVDLTNISGDISVSSSNVAKVLKIQNVAVSSNAPSAGQILQASSASAASWVTPTSSKDTTAVTGLLKGNGTAISAATAGTDYIAPTTVGSEKRVFDGLGYDLRALPNITKSAAFTLDRTVVGKNIHSTVTGTIFTVQPSVFSEGDIFSVYNHSGSDLLFNIGTLESYLVGTDTNKTGATGIKISARGIASFSFTSGGVLLISGNVS